MATDQAVVGVRRRTRAVPQPCKKCKEVRYVKALGMCNPCYSKDAERRNGVERPETDARISPGLNEILTAPGGPTVRQLTHWVAHGLLHPEVTEREGRDRWSWPAKEQRAAVAIARLVAAGLEPAAAAKVARHPNWGPVVLGPGVVVSLFELRADGAVAL